MLENEICAKVYLTRKDDSIELFAMKVVKKENNGLRQGWSTHPLQYEQSFFSFSDASCRYILNKHSRGTRICFLKKKCLHYGNFIFYVVVVGSGRGSAWVPSLDWDWAQILVVDNDLIQAYDTSYLNRLWYVSEASYLYRKPLKRSKNELFMWFWEGYCTQHRANQSK